MKMGVAIDFNIRTIIEIINSNKSDNLILPCKRRIQLKLSGSLRELVEAY